MVATGWGGGRGSQCVTGMEFQWEDEKLYRWRTAMVAEQCEWTSYHRIGHLKMGKVVNFVCFTTIKAVT